MVDSNKQSRSRIFRAKDIVPPYNRDISSERNQTEQSSGSEAVTQQDGGIPQFDLSEQILAEQRKIAATKRKRAGDQTKAVDQPQKARSIKPAPEPPPAMSPEEQVIAQIVARDIQRLLTTT